MEKNNSPFLPMINGKAAEHTGEFQDIYGDGGRGGWWVGGVVFIHNHGVVRGGRGPRSTTE